VVTGSRAVGDVWGSALAATYDTCGSRGCILPMQDVQGGSLVCPLAGVHTRCKKIADSRGWQEFLQLRSLTGMMDIDHRQC